MSKDRSREGEFARPEQPDLLLDLAVEAARLLGLALRTMRGEPEPGFANSANHVIQRIYEIDADRVHDGI